MALSNHERVTKALQALCTGLYPFIVQELKSQLGKSWLISVTPLLEGDHSLKRLPEDILKEDVAAQLRVIDRQWADVFRKTMGKAERSIVNELSDTRNKWAHGNNFSTDDTYRALDSISRLLTSISSPEAESVDSQKQELLRTRYNEQARRENKKVSGTPIEGTPNISLKCWREIISPHPDIATGRYQQAEFAADLWEVYKGRGSDEYRIPTEFFSRTYLTEGLRQLLTNALQRLSGQGGDPVIDLQTNFGGGKTHAMLALYHLFSDTPAQKLPGLENVFADAQITELPAQVRKVVIVGHKLPPGQPETKEDGTIVRTLWGEIAWQLGGREAYDMIRQSDETSTNPGDLLKDVFDRYSPCLILVDEWVAYARQLHEENDLPGGSFDTHFTFAQTLSESAKNAKQTMLVVSIPASDIEIGGERGKDALVRIKNAIGRVESPWRPATSEESFEIVRRRLFEPITENSNFVARDAVVRAFYELYQTQSAEFPSECREAAYKKKLEDSYPIHPELFTRLYSDWSSLEKFQRTRGVLRLMAKVIHSLWESNDAGLLIMPASVPMDDREVYPELTRYLDDNWAPIIEQDVDGPNSLPRQIDRENTNLGRYSACRRVTRTIYLGSAPTLKAANQGIEDRRIKLGCVQPGENTAIFGDALRRLTDRSTYLYVDGSNRYWISTQPNVTRTAQDRANEIQTDIDRIQHEVIRRLKLDKQQGDFMGIHFAPSSSSDVPDDSSMGARLVILGSNYPHIKNGDSDAQKYATEILNQRGASPRYNKNQLVFLAADHTKLENLTKHIAQYLAWESIVNDKTILNLDHRQSEQATAKRTQSDRDVVGVLNEAYQWLIIPSQPDPQGGLQWESVRIQPGPDTLVQRASKKLVHEEYLIVNYSPSRLCMEALNPYFWPNAAHIDLKKLWEFFSQYLYLPRLKNADVLLQSIKDGIASTILDSFAYAEGYDDSLNRYLGLKAGHPIASVPLSSQSLLVRPDAALQQIKADRVIDRIQPIDLLVPDPVGIITPPPLPSDPKPPTLHHFFGSIDLDALRINRDAPIITDEIIQHLTSLNGARVKVTLEIEAEIPEGAPSNVVRTIEENCRALKFNKHSFEQN
jgi:predicted AAA+ superfamily ATPase